MKNRIQYSGLRNLIDLLRNHCLIKPTELRAVEDLGERLSEAKSDQNTLRSIFRELQNLEGQVIGRELGLAFEGVPVRWLEQAVELADQARAEDEQPRPSVGAIFLNNGELVAFASRNQDGKGGHAEQLAIETCKSVAKLEGSTLLTTLEPCTERGSKGRSPCAELVLKYGVKKVIIGLPDPNPAIRGLGDLLLRANGVSVSYFPSELANRLWLLNSAFFASHTRDAFRQVFLFRRKL